MKWLKQHVNRYNNIVKRVAPIFRFSYVNYAYVSTCEKSRPSIALCMFYVLVFDSILISSTFEQMELNTFSPHKHSTIGHLGTNQMGMYWDQLKSQLKICGLTWKSTQFIQKGFKEYKRKIKQSEFGQKSYWAYSVGQSSAKRSRFSMIICIRSRCFTILFAKIYHV